jgi:hypothetical protein
VLVTTVGADSEVARLAEFMENVAARGVGEPSNWPSGCVISGTIVELTRGEEVVRYPIWDVWVANGGGVSWGLLHTTLELEPTRTRNYPDRGQSSPRLMQRGSSSHKRKNGYKK